MRRLIYPIALLWITIISAHAQWATWTPVPEPETPVYKTPEAPKINIIPFQRAPVLPGPSVIKSELVNVDCFDFTVGETINAKVKVVYYSNGENMLFLVGKKLHDSWISMDNVRLLSIGSLLSDAKTETEKSNLLFLSENFEFIAVDDKDNVYGF